MHHLIVDKYHAEQRKSRDQIVKNYILNYATVRVYNVA